MEATAVEAAAADGSPPPSNEGDTVALLPAEVLAGALEYLPFVDVRSALLTGKRIGIGAAGKVNTLNITKPLELNVRAMKRFVGNVRQVNIRCLGGDVVSEEAIYRIVPFLSGFPKLKVATLYSGDRSGRYFHAVGRTLDDFGDNDDDIENERLMRTLVHSFSGAFRAGALPSDLDLRGIIAHSRSYYCPYPREGMGGCKLCREVCEHFPLSAVGLMYGPLCEDYWWNAYTSYCIGLEARLDIMSKRSDFNEYVVNSCGGIFEETLYAGDEDGHLMDYFDISRERADKLLENLRSRGFTNPNWIHRFDPEVIAAVEMLTSKYGFNPEKLSAARVSACVREKIDVRKGPFMLGKKSYDWLVSKGFQVDIEQLVRVGKYDLEKLEQGEVESTYKKRKKS